MIDRSDRYCIIGAGPAGLLAARACKHAGIAYDQFEKNPDVGGIWDIRNDWSPMYESAHFISSKTVSCLPGFPMPAEYPDYPNHAQVFQYLRSFARHYGLYEGIEFGVAIEQVERDGETWLVRTPRGVTRYAGLFICSGNTWDPNMPTYPGKFTGEVMHSVRYRTRDVFAGKRVLVVGGGNSGCDIACDAASTATEATISLRRGYHFIPKHLFGIPADVVGSRAELPTWLALPAFEALLRVVVGDLRNYGLPKPDHRLLESHPIVNTQILHYLSHGDLRYRPDIERFEGNTVHFVDGSRLEVDLIVFATGYKVTYPFMAKSHFKWIQKYPDLFLSSIHPEYDNVCCLGLHQTDGGAFDLFDMQADMMANFILDQRSNVRRADRFRALKKTRPDLSGGMKYVKSARHATYVKKSEIRKYAEKIFSKNGWTRFGTQPAARSPNRVREKLRRAQP